MNKFKKIMLTVSCSILALGVIFIILGWATGGKTYIEWTNGGLVVPENTKYTVDETIKGEFNKIEIEVDAAHVSIVKGDEYSVHIEYKDADSNPVYEISDNKLKVKAKKESTVFGFGFSQNGSNNNRITITVPEDAEFSDVKIIDSFGDISVGCGDMELLNIEADFGNVTVENVKCNAFDGSLSAGNVTVNNLTCTTFVSDNKFGETVISNVTPYEDKIESVKIYSSSGDIQVSNLETESLEIKNDFGETSLKLKGDKEDYNYKVETDFGSVRIDGQSVSGSYEHSYDAEYNIDVSNSSGDINISFAK